MDGTNKSISKSTKYIYVCSNATDGVYSSCGLVDYEGNSKITLKYDDESILDYNDEYYVLKKEMYVYLYDYMNVTKLSDYDYIMLSSKYIITFNDEVMDIYDYSLNKLRSVDMGIREVITKDTADKSKNIELIDDENTIIINVYDNESIDEKDLESEEKVKSYVYSEYFKDTIEGRRLYGVYDSNDNLIMYYSPEYSGKSILKVYLYSYKLEAFRIINLNSNSGNLEVIDKCSDLSVGYLLDGNYTIFNPKFESAGTAYNNETDYNNAICNSVGDYTVTNTVLYDKTNLKIAFGQIKALTKINDTDYLIIHDNKVGIFR